MKNIRKLLSIVMVLAMVLALGVQAFAAGSAAVPQSVTVTLPVEYNEHTMVAYKIFNGAQNATSADGQLGVTEWASGVDIDGLLTALAGKYNSQLTGENEKYRFKTGMGAVAAAKSISKLGINSDTPEAQDFVKLIKPYLTGSVSKTFEGTPRTAELDGGYWIIVDNTTGPVTEDPNWAYSAYLLEVVGNQDVTLAKKVDLPTVKKEVEDQNDSNTDAATWGSSAAYDVGDHVPFKLTATMPGSLIGYDTYKLVFHDKMSKGLKFDNNIVLKVGENTIDSSKYTVTATGDEKSGTEITITITDVLAAPFSATINSVITVEYSAELTADSVVGVEGNPNTVTLEYSNNPNSDGTGETPEEKVTVFTFKLIVNKVGPDEKTALPGAGFTLYKWYADSSAEGGEWRAVGSEVKAAEGAEMTTFNFERLDEGSYKIEETTVPAGYNKADDIEFQVVAEFEDTATGQSVKSLVVKDMKGTEISGEGMTFTVDLSALSMSTTVVNTSGLELPETGGIGTTIFYVVGAVLVAGAVILLVTRKRANDATK